MIERMKEKEKIIQIIDNYIPRHHLRRAVFSDEKPIVKNEG
jgi:hypothetical protein